MTVAQWHTASLGPDYRLAPLKAVNESFTWKVPPSAAEGRVVVTASIWYSKLVPSVAEFLGVPPEEATPQKVNDHETWLEVRQ